jgi:GT2 family glycosyltransferase/ribosomal protein S18 acetylase RimI-like enzyme
VGMPPGFSVRRLNLEHVPEIVALFRECLPSSARLRFDGERAGRYFAMFAKRADRLGLVCVNLATAEIVGYVCGELTSFSSSLSSFLDHSTAAEEETARARKGTLLRPVLERLVTPWMPNAARRRPTGPTTKLKSIAVHPAWQHRGLGGELVRSFQEELARRGPPAEFEVERTNVAASQPIPGVGTGFVAQTRGASITRPRYRPRPSVRSLPLCRSGGVLRPLSGPARRGEVGVGAPEILLVTVSFGGGHHVRRLLQDPALMAARSRMAVIVVDNDALADSHSLLEGVPADAHVEVISSGSNLGYFGAAWWAVERYLDVHELPDWVVVCNPDIRFDGQDFFTRFLQLHQDEHALIVAPAIVSEETGRVQPIYMIQRPTPLRMRFLKWTFHWYLTGLLYQSLSEAEHRLRARLPDPQQAPPGDPRSIYAPHGSFFMLSRRYFEQGGTLQHRSFLFGEEVFVGESVRRIGGSVLYDPRLQVVHEGRGTTNYFKNRKISAYKADACARLADEFS